MVPGSLVEAHCCTPGLAVDTEWHKRAARTAPEERKIVEVLVEDTMVDRIVHSSGQEPVEEGLGVRRRLAADSRFGTVVGTEARFGWPEGKVQVAVVRMGWEAALGEDRGRQEAPMRFAEPEEDTEREVGHIELSPVP